MSLFGPSPPKVPISFRQVKLLTAAAAMGAYTAKGAGKTAKWLVKTKGGRLTMAGGLGAYLSHKTGETLRGQASNYLMPGYRGNPKR